MRLCVSGLLIGLVFAAIQIFVFPPDGFMTGDQGSKFLQTRAFASQGPFNPAIDVMSRDIDPEYRHTEPKLKNRRGRLVSEFMWLLPMLGAPFVAAAGLRELYVVPAAGALVVFVCAAKLGRRADDRDGAMTGWIVLLVTPIFFYGLELWEHGPAAACVCIAAVLLAPRLNPTEARTRGRWFAAGAAIGCGFLFREEAVVALPALLIGRAVALDRNRLRDLAAAGFWSGAGALAVFVASTPINLMMYGAALPMHITQDAWEYAKSVSYLQVRRDMATELFMPAEHAGFAYQPIIYTSALIAGAAASLYAWRRPAASRAMLPIVHLAIAVIIAIAVALPLWRLASGYRLHDAYAVASAAHTWVFAVGLLYWPWVRRADERRLARFLIVSALLTIVFTGLVVPSVGGAQWSPRFFLQAVPLLAVPVAAMAVIRQADRRILWAVRGVLAASFVMQATGIVFLRNAKTNYAEITHGLARLTVPGEVVLSDVYWVPEVTATLAPTRRMLFTWNPSDIPALAAVAADHGVERFSFVTLPPFTNHVPPEQMDVPGGRCRFVRGQEFGLDRLGLTLSRYSCTATKAE